MKKQKIYSININSRKVTCVFSVSNNVVSVHSDDSLFKEVFHGEIVQQKELQYLAMDKRFKGDKKVFIESVNFALLEFHLYLLTSTTKNKLK